MPSLSKEFQDALRADGLWSAMRWLNAKTPYRYSAIFAFEGETLRNICLVDKEDENVTGCADQPITDSYCIYVHRSGETFGVEEAAIDPRVEGHPKRRAYQCYYGVPLYGSDGKMLGTVCHFDAEPQQITADVVTELDELTPSIVRAAFDE
jgi:GAF domain-containing protein